MYVGERGAFAAVIVNERSITSQPADILCNHRELRPPKICKISDQHRKFVGLLHE